MRQPSLAASLLTVYAACILVFGWHRNKQTPNGHEFLNEHRRVPWLLAAVAFLASNLSAVEITTMFGVSAAYGVGALHFYWIGAIPALTFLVGVLLPRYKSVRLQTIPKYLGQRYTSLTMLMSAVAFCLLMLVMSGITACLASRVITFATGLSSRSGIILVFALAVCFLWSGGIGAVLLAESIQLCVLILMLAPLAVVTLQRAHGLDGLLQALPESERHTWKLLPLYSPGAKLDLTGLLGGLGLVLGISYWCGDFLLIQRLCAAKEKDMLRTPEVTMFAKILMPSLLVIPGLALANRNVLALAPSYDLSLPLLFRSLYSRELATTALSVLVANFFLGLCGQIAGAAAIFVADIYPFFRRRKQSSFEILNISRMTILGFVSVAGVSAFLSLGSRSLMETIQMVLSLLAVPTSTVFIAGVIFPRVPRRAGTAGLLAGSIVGFSHWLLMVRYGHDVGLNAAFHGALASFLGGSLTILAVTLTMLSSSLVPRRRAQPIAMRPPETSQGRRRTRILIGTAWTLVLALYLYFM